MLSFPRDVSISSAFNASFWEWFPCVARIELSALIGEGKREERCSSGHYSVSAMSFQLHFQLSHSPPTTTISAKKTLKTLAKPPVRILTAHVTCLLACGCRWFCVYLFFFYIYYYLSRLMHVFRGLWAQAGNWKWNPLEHHSPSKTDGRGSASTENLLLPYWPKFQWCIYKITLVHGHDRCFFV